MNILKTVIIIYIFLFSIISINAQNTVLGSYAGAGSTAGYSVFVGANSGFYGSSGAYNTAIGNETAKASFGEGNTWLGFLTGSGCGGTNQTILGTWNTNMSGSYGIIIGSENSQMSISQQLFIGHNNIPLIWGSFQTGELALGNYLNINSAGELMFRAFKVDASGNVGIGTTNPQAELAVDGTILAKEIKVSTEASNWPDYVFEDDYKLKDLSEVEAYIRAHKHLPEVPSAKEIEEEGVNLAEMNKLLLQKVEELMLYTITLEKAREEEKSARIVLEKRLSVIENLLKK